MTKKGSQRIDSFDFFRSYGCLAVILLHVMTGWRDDPINGLGFYSASFVRIFFGNVIVPILVRTAVPFFFMISGTLFLNPNRKVDSAYIRQKIIKILVITAFFGYFMCILELVATSKTLHLQYFYIGFLNLIQEKSWGHLWYLYVTVGLYLVTPILRVWLSEANRMELKASMAVTVILFSVIPSINDLFGIEITQFGITSPRGALMWYLVGYYLSLSYEEVMKKGWKFIRYFLFAGGG